MSSYNIKPVKGSDVRKGQYYVWYLGWKESRGIAGREFTEPIAKDLVARRRNEDLPKLTIDVSKKELRIHQLVKVRGRTEKLKFPTVPAKDITYAVQCLPPDEDTVACIYLGFNPTTRRAVHVHVYRCDSPETASVFVNHLVDILRIPDHQERLAAIEEQLVSQGEIAPRPKNFVNVYDADSVISTTPSTVHTVPNDQELSDDESGLASNRSQPLRYSSYEEDIVEKEKEAQMESLTAELKRRLGSRTDVPILLPPQDYDTIRRVRGNMDLELFTDEYEERKCKNEDIVGVKAANKTPGILSDDLFKGSSETIPNTPNGYPEKSSDSPNGSSGRGRVETTNPVEMRPKQHSSGTNERKSRGSRGSRGSGMDDNVHLVSPRWKTTGHQVYSPPGQPNSPLPVSQNNGSLSPASSDHRRNQSPSPRHNNPRRRSPSPGIPVTVYPAERRGRPMSPRRGNEPRYRSGSRGRYYDAPQEINPYPTSLQPQTGRVPYTSGNRGVDVVRLPRTPSRERYAGVVVDPNPNLSSSLPTSALRQYTQDAKAKPKKDKKKKTKKGQEPRPDYTMYPTR